MFARRVDWREVPHDQLKVAELAPDAKIARYFRLYELTVSQIAARQGIDNSIPSDAVLHQAVGLARAVLDPIRERWGAYSPNSVHRCQALERVLKGRPADWRSRSQHTRGQAADVRLPRVNPRALAIWLVTQTDIVFDQLILECYDPVYIGSGWVHISRVSGDLEANRRSVQTLLASGQWRRGIV